MKRRAKLTIQKIWIAFPFLQQHSSGFNFSIPTDICKSEQTQQIHNNFFQMVLIMKKSFFRWTYLWKSVGFFHTEKFFSFQIIPDTMEHN